MAVQPATHQNAQINVAVLPDATVREVVHALVGVCHAAAVERGWWTDLATGEDLQSSGFEPPRKNVGELLCLVHSELSEAMEGYRTHAMDAHLPSRPALEVELADAVIRIFDMAGGLGLDLPGALADKLAYNRTRADHAPAARRAAGGKSF